jgi:hypothetical protein
MKCQIFPKRVVLKTFFICRVIYLLLFVSFCSRVLLSEHIPETPAPAAATP